MPKASQRDFIDVVRQLVKLLPLLATVSILACQQAAADELYLHGLNTPPTFHAAAPHPLPCYDQLHAASIANCSAYRSETLPVVAQVCPLNASSGVLILRRDNNASSGLLQSPQLLLSTAIYRLRFLGPAGIWLLQPNYCQADLAVATYSLPLPGRYSLELFMLYLSFSFDTSVSSTPESYPWAGYLTLEYGAGAGAAGGGGGEGSCGRPQHFRQTWSSAPDLSVLERTDQQTPDQQQQQQYQEDRHTQHDQKQDPEATAGLPLCNSTGPLPGRWRFHSWPVPTDAAPLLRTCVWADDPPPSLASQHNCSCDTIERLPLRGSPHPAGLYWQPDGCRLRPVHGLLPQDPHPPSNHHQQHPQSHQSHQQQGLAFALSSVPAQLHRQPLAMAEEKQQQQLQQPREEEKASSPVPPPSSPTITQARCLPPGRLVCFVGDSHSRKLHNSLVMWTRDFALRPNNVAKDTLRSNRSVYYKMMWGSDWPRPKRGERTDPLVVRRCTDVVANVGQWAASHQAGKTGPRSVANYMQSVGNVRRKLLALAREHGVRVFWVTSSLPSLKAHYELAGTDWRTDPYMLLFNRLASDIMRGAEAGGGERKGECGEGNGGSLEDSAAVPIIDIWSPSHILADTTRDGVHFENTGPVGQIELQLLLQALCSGEFVGDGVALQDLTRDGGE